MSTVRVGHTANLLGSGKVLVTGGRNDTGVVASSAELYNPATGTWALTNSMTTARAGHAGVLLADGRVLVSGGIFAFPSTYLASAEIYNPTSGVWTVTGPMNIARYSHTATLLPDGRVLAVGGDSTNGQIATVELYNPVSGTWTLTNSIPNTRDGHSATLLTNGLVLVAGGFNGASLRDSELFNPTNGTWTATGALSIAHESHTATLLNSGLVLVAGGIGNNGPNPVLTSCELFNPANNTWRLTGSMNFARYGHTATLLPGGKVLVAGGAGTTSGNAISNAEIYDPATETWTVTASLNVATVFQSANLLSNGTTLIAGGYASFFNVLSNAELYVTVPVPTPIVLSNLTRLPGAMQLNFTNTPNLGFTVWATSNVASTNWTVLGAATQISSGKFEYTDSQITNHPVRFYRVSSP